MRLAVLATAFCFCAVGLAVADDTQAAIRRPTHIPAERLDRALQELARERGLVMAYRSEVVGDTRTQGASGNLTREEALAQLLSGSGLEFRFLDEKTVTIVPAPATSPRSSLDGGPSEQSVGGDKGLEEIIVTAQKRSERLAEVPVPVTSLSAEKLADNNQLRISDYYSTVPGLTMTAGDGFGAPVLIIRGISTGSGDPTVGVTVDDLPYAMSFGVPDIDPSDVARIEVLRGPQGTLYGASSMGGLLKIVTADPTTDRLSGRLQAGTLGIRNGGQLGYNFRGAVNIPLSDTWAIRASAFARKDPGYIDNTTNHASGVNEQDVRGGRVAALWHPSDAFSLKLSALLQSSNLHGSPDVSLLPGVGDLQQQLAPGTGGDRADDAAYSATVSAKLGIVDLTSITGYTSSKNVSNTDTTTLFGSTQFGVSAYVPLLETDRNKQFTQEIRLAMPIGSRIDWLLGGFYAHQRGPGQQDIYAIDATTLLPVGTLLTSGTTTTSSEYAAFTDLTFHFTDRFNIQVGGRESRYQRSIYTIAVGPFIGGTSITPEADTSGSAFTYLVTPQLKISPDLMLYARLASGYRLGGPNSLCTVFHYPCEFGPDTTRNYEIGAKGNTLSHRLSFDASLYYIDWRSIQVGAFIPSNGLGYTTNAGGAKSQGIELSTEARPLKGMTLAAWVAWNDAVLTAGFPTNSSAYGISGDRLPFSSRFSGNFSLDQEFPLTERVSGFAGGSVSYIGNRESIFTGDATRQVYPAYAKTDIRAGVRYDSWTVNLFVNNLTDRRGVLRGGLGSVLPFNFYYIQPRTTGVNVSWMF